LYDCIDLTSISRASFTHNAGAWRHSVLRASYMYSTFLSLANFLVFVLQRPPFFFLFLFLLHLIIQFLNVPLKSMMFCLAWIHGRRKTQVPVANQQLDVTPHINWKAPRPNSKARQETHYTNSKARQKTTHSCRTSVPVSQQMSACCNVCAWTIKMHRPTTHALQRANLVLEFSISHLGIAFFKTFWVVLELVWILWANS
jgi:hypothetical protein